MKTNYKIAIALVAGAAVGGAALAMAAPASAADLKDMRKRWTDAGFEPAAK
jgi:hypothetical protein